jgi:hypothetical protein
MSEDSRDREKTQKTYRRIKRQTDDSGNRDSIEPQKTQETERRLKYRRIKIQKEESRDRE